MEEKTILDLHLDLKKKISNETDRESPEYENFCKQVEAKIGRGLARGKKTVQEKLDALENEGSLEPGEYGVLRKMFEDSNNRGFVKFIDETERQIKLLKEPSDSEQSGAFNSLRGTKRPAEVVYSRSAGFGGPSPASDGNKAWHGDSVGSSNAMQPCSSMSTDDADPGTDDYYTSGQPQTGYLLILNSTENRKGTEYDVKALTDFFREELKFEVDDPRALEQEDFTREKLDRYLEELQIKLNQDFTLKKFYCFICVVLSHGDQKGVRTKCGGFKSVEDIRRMFNNKQIPKFTGRPKLFFVQACRGLDVQDGSMYDDEEDDVSMLQDEDDAQVSIPVDADTLIGFSTTPGYKSFRRTRGPKKGSWFIQELVDVFRAQRSSCHVEDMLVKVRGNVAKNWSTTGGGKQMPCVWSTLTKKLMLK